jgi:hypothetical protein
VRADRAPLELAQDALVRTVGARVDQHVPDQVDVDRVARAAVELEDVRG